jgi:hypothetical protein
MVLRSAEDKEARGGGMPAAMELGHGGHGGQRSARVRGAGKRGRGKGGRGE